MLCTWTAGFVVVANDKGDRLMLAHAGELGFSARQVGFNNAKVSAAKTGKPQEDKAQASLGVALFAASEGSTDAT